MKQLINPFSEKKTCPTCSCVCTSLCALLHWQMARRHGNMYTLWLGQTPVIVLNGFQAVKDALISHSEDFVERPITPFLRDIIGIIFANGHTWKQQRRFSLMTLRNLGLGKRTLEEWIQGQAQLLVQTFAREKGRPMDPSVSILSSINNVIAAVLFGHCFSSEDESFQQLFKGSRAMAEFEALVTKPRIPNINFVCFPLQLYDAFPTLMKHLSPMFMRSLLALTHMQDLRRLVKDEIKSHQNSWVPEKSQDFIDSYLSQMWKVSNTSTFKENNMIQVITDLFIAGSDTTTISLLWAILYMMAHPEIQERVQEELDTIIGSSREIRYEDRMILPYTNAVLHEVLRYSSISATGVIRKCTKDTTVQGFPVSKGTLIFPNLFSVLYDPDHWETPQEFNPSHFLDKAGNFLNKEAFLPFSAGHRVCLGEQLAKTSLFIMFSSILRAFTFRLPEGVKEINEKPIGGFILQPEPYKMCAVPR
uniref:Cytochrome P450 2J5-like n=1 Tax=Crocodylus porosus TaxID=8502 RepID=A0A7M4EZ36_CROPO